MVTTKQEIGEPCVRSYLITQSPSWSMSSFTNYGLHHFRSRSVSIAFFKVLLGICGSDDCLCVDFLGDCETESFTAGAFLLQPPQCAASRTFSVEYFLLQFPHNPMVLALAFHNAPQMCILCRGLSGSSLTHASTCISPPCCLIIGKNETDPPFQNC